MIDRAFRLVRRLPAGEFWPGYAFVVLAGSLVAGLAWIETSGLGPGWDDPAVPRLMSLARVTLTVVHVLLGMGLARATWERMRGPLDPGAPTWRIATGGFVLAPVIAATAFLPVGVAFADEIGNGEIALLSGEWLHELVLAGAGLLGALIVPFLLLAPSIVVIEGRNPLAALLRSVKLTAYGGFKSHGVFITLIAVRLAMTAGLTFLVIGFDGFFSVDGNAFDRRVAFGCAGLVVEAILAPQLQLALTLAYLDARVRAEGLDVEQVGRACGLLQRETAA